MMTLANYKSKKQSEVSGSDTKTIKVIHTLMLYKLLNQIVCGHDKHYDLVI